MISQTDIIKTLVNKNCTDESVLSTALSKDCTPTKLLEKLTETERFDLALDISMKSGLDVIPLWRTWAMRCLKNRNFQGAREKFRHCFPRLRLPGYRVSPAQNRLLADILKELSQMKETHFPLSEELEFIKQGKEIPQVEDEAHQSVASRPTIFNECLYYLKEYGGLEDRLKFHMRNQLWDLLAKLLIENSSCVNIEKFFLGEMMPYSLKHGFFGNLLIALHEIDPELHKSLKYFKALYSFCQVNRRLNLLYLIQSTIGDHLNAAHTQINSFFLMKPFRNYRELNSRLSSLIKARDNYDEFLNKCQQENETEVRPTASLFKILPRDQVERLQKSTDLQIEITRNFSINEVSGCINSIEVPIKVEDDEEKETDTNDTPVTLYDRTERRKTFLAALALIYFDLSCSTYFSKSGLDLANQLITDYGLDKIRVFKTAMRIIIEDESCNILENTTLLLEKLREDYMTRNATKPTKPSYKSNPPNQKTVSSHKHTKKPQSPDRASLKSSSSSSSVKPTATRAKLVSNRESLAEGARRICDEVIKDAIGSCREPDYKMELAKLLSGEAKIELFIELGKLSNAQGLAFSMNRPDYVSTIIEEAIRLNQNHVKTVCQLWLAKHETNTPR